MESQSTELNSLISSFNHLQLNDKPRVETITVYKPLCNMDETLSQFILQETIEINYSFSPPKEIIRSRWIVSEFRPVFERETNSLFRIYKQLHIR